MKHQHTVFITYMYIYTVCNYNPLFKPIKEPAKMAQLRQKMLQLHSCVNKCSEVPYQYRKIE